MYIQTLTEIEAVPTPALGLLPAIHDVEVESVAALNRGYVLSDLAAIVNSGAVLSAIVDGQSVVLTAVEPGPLAVVVNSSRAGVLSAISEQVGADGVLQITRISFALDPREKDEYSVIAGGETYSLSVGSLKLPEILDGKGRVFLNDTPGALILPETGKWPARELASGELSGCDGRVHYRVTHKPGTTSYYPQHFERNIFTFSFSNKTFPLGDIFEFSRFFYFRLIGNNTTAVWSVIFEVGERVDQSFPENVYELEGLLVDGSKVVQLTGGLGNLKEMMEVNGEGIPEGLDGVTFVESVDAAAGTVTLTKKATESGLKVLTFRAGAGPNIERIRWLPPMMEEQILMTDLKSMNELGVWIKNWGEQEKINPDGSRTIDPNRNEAGYEAYRLIYANRYPVPHECMPKSSDFLIRLRIGQFDTENTVADPRGYAAYVIRADEEDDSKADSA